MTVSCVRVDGREPAGAAKESKTDVAQVVSSEQRAPDNGAEGEKAELPQISVLDALIGKDTTWGLFSDSMGLVAISSTGEEVHLYSEPFKWGRIDYGLGLLWLNRSWSAPYQPGLFIADLRSPMINPVRVAHLKKSFRVSRDGIVSISMDAGAAPYHVYNVDVTAADIQITSVSKYVACKDECTVDGSAVELLRKVRQNPTLFEAASFLDTGKYTVVEQHTTCPKCGRFVPLPETSFGLISVAFTDHPGEVGWQIYDPRTDDFISDSTFQRSKTPHPEGHYANYIMVCKGGKALVVERQFVTSELSPLSVESFDSQGVCLTGGTSFIEG